MLPEPDEGEREALLEALRGLDDDRRHPAYSSPWRRAALDPDEEQPVD